ncbi:hypothetical protein [Alkalibacillus silvisoli]|uniref:Uncharacterized protein n=1 Tax=Alkalibacillus silvisoli TaxID=392823 RepID=A0ABN0ZPB9_9BACI
MTTWIIAIIFIVGFIIWLSSELATNQDGGKGFKSFWNAFKNHLIVVVPFFFLGGVIYFLFFR